MLQYLAYGIREKKIENEIKVKFIEGVYRSGEIVSNGRYLSFMKGRL